MDGDTTIRNVFIKWDSPNPTVGQKLALWLVLFASFSDFPKDLIINVLPITSFHSMDSKAGFLMRCLCITTDNSHNFIYACYFVKVLCLNMSNCFLH